MPSIGSLFANFILASYIRSLWLDLFLSLSPSQTRRTIRRAMFNIHSKCSMNCSSRLATLAKRDEHFNEHFAMKRPQRRSKQIKYAHLYAFAGFMRKIGIEHGNDEN